MQFLRVLWSSSCVSGSARCKCGLSVWPISPLPMAYFVAHLSWWMDWRSLVSASGGYMPPGHILFGPVLFWSTQTGCGNHCLVVLCIRDQTVGNMAARNSFFLVKG
ncbi:unnamed protein product [Ostreobium quekettii]|uniref:Uncharacterized protein n=1 Tax=Ostreobium quekettii TaxID=121088 RepID=A0A8S1J4S0_9CHLO|nr:unnamed protein product [Ostreobium quekettii]